MPGRPRLIGYEYVHHGTLFFIVSSNVALREVIFIPSLTTRKKNDYATRIAKMMQAHPDVKLRIVADWNTHRYESLVCLVAAGFDSGIGLSEKDKKELSVQGRVGMPFFLTLPIALLPTTPPSMLLGSTKLKSDSAFFTRSCSEKVIFISIENRRSEVLAFVQYDNKAMAKPHEWTKKGKALSRYSFVPDVLDLLLLSETSLLEQDF